jgi:hypothetical protein
MFSMAMPKSYTGSDPDDYPFFTPTDPSLRRGTAAFHLEVCIHNVASEAVKHGNPKALVRDRISQHQTQFDAVLDTLDTIFRIGDTQPTAGMQSDHGAVASSGEAEDARMETTFQVRRSLALATLVGLRIVLVKSEQQLPSKI